ncbi:MAG: hypothetical protein JOZ83_11080 [Silvibacterium sp.]|nr:hypothetical protein [Silvibacterium sp.]
MKFLSRPCIALLVLVLIALSTQQITAQTQSSATSQPEAVLHPADLAKILPGSVFFRGQSATTQGRNSGGVRYADGYFTFAALVDNSGYSTGIQEKYQAYFITEVPITIGGHTLAPGAYGTGIVKNGGGPQFVVLDIGAHDLFTTGAVNDAKLHRPTPLQVIADDGPGKYRLYFGRNYVEFERAK